MYFDHNGVKPHWGWSWLERWMAARPWENRALKEPSDAATPMRKEREKSVEMMTTDSRSVQSYTDDSPPPPPQQHQHPNYDDSNNNNDNDNENSGSSKRTSPITTTLLQLQRQQQRMLHGAAAGYDQADSDCSSTPGSNSNTPSNSENLHPAAKRSYMATTKAAQAKIRSQTTAKNNNVRTPAEEVDLQTKKKRFSLPVKDNDQGRESSMKPGSTGRLSTSPNASLGTTPRATNSRSASQYAASDKASQSYRSDKSSSQTYKFEKASTRRSDYNQGNMQLNTSYNSDPRPSRRQGGNFMSSSYNVERGSRKASEILAMAYKADQTRPSSYKSGRDSFTQQSYNGGNSSSSSRPSRRNEDFLSTSYNNHDRPRRSVDVRQQQQSGASHDSSRSDKDDFLAHYNAEMSRKKQGDLMHQSLNYERPSQRSSNTHHPQAQRHSRKSGEFSSKTDRPFSRGADFMQRSYQSDRPMYRSGDFTGSSLASSYGDFRKPFR